MVITRILGEHITIPWDCRIDEWTRGVLVDEDRKVDSNLRSSSLPNIRGQGPSVHRKNAEINRDRRFKPRPTGIGHVGLLSHPAGRDYGWPLPFLDHSMVL